MKTKLEKLEKFHHEFHNKASSSNAEKSEIQEYLENMTLFQAKFISESLLSEVMKNYVDTGEKSELIYDILKSGFIDKIMPTTNAAISDTETREKMIEGMKAAIKLLSKKGATTAATTTTGFSSRRPTIVQELLSKEKNLLNKYPMLETTKISILQLLAFKCADVEAAIKLKKAAKLLNIGFAMFIMVGFFASTFDIGSDFILLKEFTSNPNLQKWVLPTGIVIGFSLFAQGLPFRHLDSNHVV